MGYEDEFSPTRPNGRYRLGDAAFAWLGSKEEDALIADPRPYPYRRRQSAVFQRGRARQRPTVAPAGYATPNLPLLKTLKTATVAPTLPASR